MKYRAVLTVHVYQHCGSAMASNIARTVLMRLIAQTLVKITSFSVPSNGDAFPKCGNVTGKLTARVLKHVQNENDFIYKMIRF